MSGSHCSVCGQVGIHLLFRLLLLCWIDLFSIVQPATILLFQQRPCCSPRLPSFSNPVSIYQVPMSVSHLKLHYLCPGWSLHAEAVLLFCPSSEPLFLHINPMCFISAFLFHWVPAISTFSQNWYSVTLSSTSLIFCLCTLSPNCSLSTSVAPWIRVLPLPQIPMVGFSYLLFLFQVVVTNLARCNQYKEDLASSLYLWP